MYEKLPFGASLSVCHSKLDPWHADRMQSSVSCVQQQAPLTNAYVTVCLMCAEPYYQSKKRLEALKTRIFGFIRVLGSFLA